MAENRTRWKFQEHRRISGLITTLTPFHPGSGQVIPHPHLTGEDGKAVEVNAVTVDYQGRAVIHGSAIKGILRAWLDESSFDEEKREWLVSLFGESGEETSTSSGGRIEFHDCPVAGPLEQVELPDWNPLRQTFIEPRTAVDRHTRTVRDGHLYHSEYVPAGVQFQVVITGTFSSRQSNLLLVLLERAFSAESGIPLGADTANGCGRMAWSLEKVSAFTAKNLAAWLQAGQERQPIAVQLEQQGEERVKSSVIKKLAKGVHSGGAFLSFSLSLQFDAAFLSGLVQESHMDAGVERTTLATRKTQAGEPVLSASSFRGAFRSQGERILRTLADGAQNPGRLCCNPLLQKPQPGCCAKIDTLEEKENLCLACRIFGAPGWRSPLEITDFTLAEKQQTEWLRQPMIAVDRFTGAAAEGALFTCEGSWQPTLNGTLRCRTDLLPPGGLALLALTLRDLREGDIFFGYGRARGYGRCRGELLDSLWESDDFQQRVNEDREELKTLLQGGSHDIS